MAAPNKIHLHRPAHPYDHRSDGTNYNLQIQLYITMLKK